MHPRDTFEPRVATPDDTEPLLALMREFYAEEHLVFDELRARASLGQLLARPELGQVILVTTAGASAGHIVVTYGFSLEFNGRFALLDEFFLRPAFRGRGWGARCLELVADTARQLNLTCVRLEVNRANLRARSLYLRAGFRDDQRDLLTRWL